MLDKYTIWTVHDVRRAHEAQMAKDWYDTSRRVILPPNTELLYSPRAPRGTAELEMYRQELLDNPDRVAPVLRVSAGYRATDECYRYVTLVRSSDEGHEGMEMPRWFSATDRKLLEQFVAKRLA